MIMGGSGLGVLGSPNEKYSNKNFKRNGMVWTQRPAGDDEAMSRRTGLGCPGRQNGRFSNKN